MTTTCFGFRFLQPEDGLKRNPKHVVVIF